MLCWEKGKAVSEMNKKKIVDGSVFLNLPNGTRFRSMNLITNKPMDSVKVKTGLRKDGLGMDVMGFYYTDEKTGEETSSCMPYPPGCRFLIVST